MERYIFQKTKNNLVMKKLERLLPLQISERLCKVDNEMQDAQELNIEQIPDLQNDIAFFTHIDSLNTMSKIELFAGVIKNDDTFIGKIKIIVKRIIRKCAFWIFMPALIQQSEYNRQNIEALRFLNKTLIDNLKAMRYKIDSIEVITRVNEGTPCVNHRRRLSANDKEIFICVDDIMFKNMCHLILLSFRYYQLFINKNVVLVFLYAHCDDLYMKFLRAQISEMALVNVCFEKNNEHSCNYFLQQKPLVVSYAPAINIQNYLSIISQNLPIMAIDPVLEKETPASTILLANNVKIEEYAEVAGYLFENGFRI